MLINGLNECVLQNTRAREDKASVEMSVFGDTEEFVSLSHLMSMTWLTTTLGWVAFPSPSSYRNSLKSHTTAMALCQPFFTPVGLGT